ncbi:MAG: site-2 protease family protein [Cytophaga sp.]|uniref:site-2 protease family protein n=1 Tax=Cytophaga sp. TaxID=29535 RepID=UPI003F7DF761
MLKKYKQLSIHILLFILTLATTTLAGAQWTGAPAKTEWDFVLSGLYYSITFLGILTMHEFGHYYYAKKYKVDVTLPYYIPFYFPGLPSFGTFGAFIRMKSIIHSRKQIFDIGIAGPLAGFVGALALLIYGFATLPEKEYIYEIHPDYAVFGDDYAEHVYGYEYLKAQSDKYVDAKYHLDSLYYEQNKKQNSELKEPVKQYETEFTEFAAGDNLLLLIFKKIFSYQGGKIPNQFELFHYPFIFAAYLALFFTALNLIPIGQLDGGHVIYGLFGYEWHKKISTTAFVVFVFIAGLGLFKVNPLEINFFTANPADQLLFSFIYVGFLFMLFSRMFERSINVVLVALAVFTGQCLLEFIFPEITGKNGWLLYAILISRFIGVQHPPALDETPLDFKRKVLGWLSLVIFVLCFTPDVLLMYTYTK